MDRTWFNSLADVCCPCMYMTISTSAELTSNAELTCSILGLLLPPELLQLRRLLLERLRSLCAGRHVAGRGAGRPWGGCCWLRQTAVAGCPAARQRTGTSLSTSTHVVR